MFLATFWVLIARVAVLLSLQIHFQALACCSSLWWLWTSGYSQAWQTAKIVGFDNESGTGEVIELASSLHMCWGLSALRYGPHHFSQWEVCSN